MSNIITKHDNKIMKYIKQCLIKRLKKATKIAENLKKMRINEQI